VLQHQRELTEATGAARDTLAKHPQRVMLGAMAAESKPSAAERGPDLHFERRAMRRGATIVAGVDEAGRGPLAGPVVVAAVVLDPKRVPKGLNDSKQLTHNAREELADKIMANAMVSVVAAPPTIIARLNILWATMWAMRRAVLGLPVVADHVLIDGNQVPRDMPCKTEPIIDGDTMSASIAAASIIAKVTRDRMCEVMDCDAPAYGFARHKGYSAPEHFAALTEHGPCRHHRADWAPVIAALEQKTGVLVLTP
jgi:ribonuclease HII